MPVIGCGQISSKQWIAGIGDTEHHFANVDRAAKGVYGKAIDGFAKFDVSLENKSFYVYDSIGMCQFSFYKNIKETEAGVRKIVVYSKEDKEFQCVTLSQSYAIVYRYSAQTMSIYKLK